MYRTLSDQIRSTPLTNKNIILDIDETLVYSHDEIDKLKKLGLFSDPKFISTRERIYVLRFKDKKENIWGVKRPYIEKFLVFCFSYFKRVIIWSAGTEDYVKKLVEHLFQDLRKPDLIYTREDCIMETVDGKERPTIKPLNKLMEKEPWLNLTPENTIFIDDTPHTFKSNPENAIHIPKFNIGMDVDEESGSESETESETESESESDSENILSSDSIFKEENSLSELIEWFMKPEIMNTKDIRSLNKNIFSRKVSK